MITHCPACGKAVPTKAESCGQCHATLQGLDAEYQTELARRRLRDRIYRWRMASFLASALMLAAACWYFLGSNGLTELPGRGPVLMAATGAIAYLVIRVVLFGIRRQLRRLR